MAVTVIVPNALRPFAAGNDRVPLEAQTVGEALQKLTQQYPQIADHLPAPAAPDQGVYRNGMLVGKLQGLETPLRPGDRLTLIVPAGEL